MSYFFFPELEQFVDPLRATCTLKVKANSVKQEYEKQDELKRSALRAVAALLQIPKAGMTQYFKILNHRMIPTSVSRQKSTPGRVPVVDSQFLGIATVVRVRAEGLFRAGQYQCRQSFHGSELGGTLWQQCDSFWLLVQETKGMVSYYCSCVYTSSG